MHMKITIMKHKILLLLLLFHRSDAAESTAGRKSVSQSQVFSAKRHPQNEERDTRIIKSTGPGTNAGENSAKIAGLRCLSQESCVKQCLKLPNYLPLREGVILQASLCHIFVNVSSLLFPA